MTKTIIAVFSAVIILSSCTKESTNNNGGGSESLFMSFKTPDWERTVPCDLLVFDPVAINDSTSKVFAESASTRHCFYFSYPLDSSEMTRPGNLKKYAIANYGENTEPFQFSQKLPMDANSLTDLTRRLASLEGFNATSYNEIQSISYVSSDNQYATFIVKGAYSLQAQQVASNPLVTKPVTGSYALKVKTTRN